MVHYKKESILKSRFKKYYFCPVWCIFRYIVVT